MRAGIALVLVVALLIVALSHLPSASAEVNHCPSWQQQYAELTSTRTNNLVITARHRGSFDESLPENSIGAFRKAFEECRPAVETDVRATADGELVVFHDTHVGKMLEPSYDPETDKGPNSRLNQLTLAQLKSKKLVRPDRRPTEYTVPTVAELIDTVVVEDPNSIVHLEVKEAAALLPTLRLLAKKSEEHPEAELRKRFLIKFIVAEYPTPEHFTSSMQAQGLPTDFLLMPNINPAVAEKLNGLAPLPDPKEFELSTNAARSVALWGEAPMTLAPIIEVLVKDSTEFKRTEKDLGSRFGPFERPTSLALDDVKKGTVAEFAALTHHYQKKLGAFVPIPDYVMFSPGPVAGYTVPNTFGDKKPIPVTDAFFNNTSSCCYRLSDRRTPSAIAAERYDWRENLDFLRSIGANFLTADDADSVEVYALEKGYLNTAARANPRPAPVTMNSSLALKIRNRQVPDRAIVRIKGWNGGSSGAWGGQVCLFTDPGKALWTVRCDHKEFPFDNRLQIETVGDKMRIRDPSSLQCATSTPGVWDRVAWGKDCNSPRALWTRTPEHRFVDEDGRQLNFQWDDRYSRGHPFSYNYFTTGDTSSWSRWKLEPAD